MSTQLRLCRFASDGALLIEEQSFTFKCASDVSWERSVTAESSPRQPFRLRNLSLESPAMEASDVICLLLCASSHWRLVRDESVEMSVMPPQLLISSLVRLVRPAMAERLVMASPCIERHVRLESPASAE